MVDMKAERLESTTELRANRNLCRLCLTKDEVLTDIFEQQDANCTTTLAERLFDLLQIQYEKSSTLSTSICPRCLYMVEIFTSFRLNVKKCELELQRRILRVNCQFEQIQRPGLNGTPGIFEPEEDCTITVVDPLQECESSDDDFSMESDYDIDNPPPPLEQKISPLAQMTASEAKTKYVEELHSVDGSRHNEKIAFGVSTLETLAMEFTKNTFLCQFCDMAFITHQDCCEHELCHDPANPFSCNFCSLNTSNRQNLIYHIKEIHRNERPYICALCNKGFCRRSDLKKHTIVHTGVRPFTCPVCAKSFSRNTNLTKHMRIHSGIKPHVCRKCPRSFTTSGELLRHTRSHAEEKPLQCGKCPASFTRKDKLQLHEQTHFRKGADFLLKQGKGTQTQNSSASLQSENIIVSLNPYADVSTQMDFGDFPHESLGPRMNYESQKLELSPGTSSKYQYSKHTVYKHSILPAQLQQGIQPSGNVSTASAKCIPRTKPRIIACVICAKTFTRERDLQRHQALHLDSLFTCKQCGCGFNRREKLVRHEHEQHHPQYSCSQCHMTYSKREALLTHMKVHELQHNIALTQVASTCASGDSSAIKSEELHQQPETAADISFYSQMVPTMNLGFYSELRLEEKNGV